jgi:hypothetical protein
MKKVVLIVLALGLLIACKKKKTEEEPTTPITIPVNPPQAPVFFINIPADADGVLTSSQDPYEFTNLYVTRLGKATAFFYTAPGNYNYVDAGVVKCNDSTLIKQSSGSYYFGGKPINGQPFSGINYGSGSTWTVSGTASVPSFTFANTNFPTIAALTSGTVISKTSLNTITFNGATNADSVVVMLSCDSVLKKRTVSAAAGTCTFTAAEASAVKKTGSTNFVYLNFISYKIQANAVSTKKYYMVNSITSTNRVNLQ